MTQFIDEMLAISCRIIGAPRIEQIDAERFVRRGRPVGAVARFSKPQPFVGARADIDHTENGRPRRAAFGDDGIDDGNLIRSDLGGVDRKGPGEQVAPKFQAHSINVSAVPATFGETKIIVLAQSREFMRACRFRPFDHLPIIVLP